MKTKSKTSRVFHQLLLESDSNEVMRLESPIFAKNSQRSHIWWLVMICPSASSNAFNSVIYLFISLERFFVQVKCPADGLLEATPNILVSNELISHFDGSIWLVTGLWNSLNHYGTETHNGGGKILNKCVHIDTMLSRNSCKPWQFFSFTSLMPISCPVAPHFKGALLHFDPWLWWDLFSLNQSVIIWSMWRVENVHWRNTEKEGCGGLATVLR